VRAWVRAGIVLLLFVAVLSYRLCCLRDDEA
jgi:hypothetical protein